MNLISFPVWDSSLFSRLGKQLCLCFLMIVSIVFSQHSLANSYQTKYFPVVGSRPPAVVVPNQPFQVSWFYYREWTKYRRTDFSGEILEHSVVPQQGAIYDALGPITASVEITAFTTDGESVVYSNPSSFNGLQPFTAERKAGSYEIHLGYCLSILGDCAHRGSREYFFNDSPTYKVIEMDAKYYFDVANIPPTVNIITPAQNASFSPNEGISITAIASDDNGDITKVRFYYSDSTLPITEKTYIGEVDSSVVNQISGDFEFQWNNPPSGHSLTLYAEVHADGNEPVMSNGVGIQVNSPPSLVQLASPHAGAEIRRGQNTTLKANVVDDGTITQVWYYGKGPNDSGDVFLGTTTGNTVGSCDNCYDRNWVAGPHEGPYQLWALAIDNLGARTYSPKVTVNVTVNDPPTIVLNQIEDFVQYESRMLEALPADSDGTIASVEFFANGSSLGSDNSAPYQLSWSPPPGNYVLTALATDNEGGQSSSQPFTVSVEALDPPNPPNSLTIDGSSVDVNNFNGSYTVAWSSQDADSYQLEESINGVWESSPVQTGSQLSRYFPDKDAGVYRYRVRACNAAGCGSASHELGVTVTLSAPSRPDDLLVEASDPNTGDYSIRWSPVTSSPTPTYYRLQEKEGSIDSQDPWVDVAGGADPLATIYSFSKPAGRYSYQVSACNPAACSAYGIQRTVEVLAPVLHSPIYSSGVIGLQGVAMHEDATIQVTAIHDSSITANYSGAAIEWESPTALRFTISEETPIGGALYELGVRVILTNPNGSFASINVYGNRQAAILNLTDSSPTIGTNGTIYVGVENDVYALDPATGDVLQGWPFSTDDKVTSTPAVDAYDGTIYVGSWDSNMYAIAPEGFGKWSVPTGGRIVSSPILDESRTIYFGSMDGVLYAVHPVNGGIKWQFTAGGQGIGTTPVLSGDGTIYVSTVDGQIHAIGRGILGPDVLVWDSVDESLLAYELDALNWQPNPDQVPQYLKVGRLFQALLQPPLSFNRNIVTFWTYALVNGVSIEEIASAFLASQTGQISFPNGTSDSDFLDALYSRVFPGEGNPVLSYRGSNYSREDILTLLAAGASRASVAVIFADSTDYSTRTDGILLASFEYFYTENYDWLVFDCDTGDEWNRDCDNDELPDRWEILFFGDIESQSGSGDADNDGTTNLAEFLSREDPCADECLYVEEPPTPELGDTDPQELASSAEVGAIAAQFNVNELGAATYSIPIFAVPGVAGVTPQVSLDYSSTQSSNGLVGVGWSIGGISTITRCPQTIAQDGQTRGVTLTEDDRFCYNGQRLVPDEVGIYGSVGMTYRTEIDSNVVVTSVGGTLGHPDYFQVEAKDGSTTELGNTDDSKIKVGENNFTHSWVISRFEDNVGNPIVYSYLSEGGHRVSTIEYAFSNGVALSSLEFDYDATRQDSSNRYVFGYREPINFRLGRIDVYNPSVVRSYHLEYLPTSLTNPVSRLEKLWECADTEKELCIQPTTFTWSVPESGFELVATSTDNFITKAPISGFPADINGDGKMDLTATVYQPSGSTPYWNIDIGISDGNTLARGADDYHNILWNIDDLWYVADYDGDGRSDLIFPEWLSQVYVLYSDGTGYDSLPNETKYVLDVNVPDQKKSVVMDFNGDGLQDLIYEQDSSTLHLYLTQSIEDGSSWRREFAESPLVFSVSQVQGQNFDPDGLLVADINNDGQLNVLRPNLDTVPPVIDTYKLKNDGTSELFNQYTLPTGHQDFTDLRLNDINSDGYPDLLWVLKTDAVFHIQVYLNTGTSFEASDLLNLHHSFDESKVFFVDYNRDGYKDLLAPDGVRIWNEVFSTFDAPIPNTLIKNSSDYSYTFLDLEGDGQIDLLEFVVSNSGSENATHTSTNTYKSPTSEKPVNVIEGIDNGLGSRTTIQYGLMNEDGIYTANHDARERSWNLPEGTQALPKTDTVYDMMSGGYLVERVGSVAPSAGSEPDNVSGASMSWVSYEYVGAKFDSSGRGRLGFRQLVTVDEQTGVRTTTTYRQDFPFIGYPTGTIVEAPIGSEFQILNERANTYIFQDYNSQTLSHESPPYQIRTATVEEWMYELNTGELSSYVITDNTNDDGTSGYDSWGNVETMSVSTYGGSDSGIGQLLLTVETENSYDDPSLGEEYSRRKGRLSESIVTHSRPGKVPVTRSSQFTYYESGALQGLLKTETIAAGTEDELETLYGYDASGNILTTTLTGASGPDGTAIQSRVSRSAYDENSRFITHSYVKNGENENDEIQTSYIVERNNLGLPTLIEDVNGVYQRTFFNSFGRQFYEMSELGGSTRVTYHLADSSLCPASTEYYADTQTADGARVFTCYDLLGRAIKSGKLSFDGYNWDASRQEFDSKGRKVHESLPYIDSIESPYWTVTTYDLLGRVERIDFPDNSFSEVSYLGNDVYGLRTVFRDRTGKTKTEWKNALGEVVRVEDALDGVVIYDYDSTGNLISTNTTGPIVATGAPASITVTVVHDDLGRKLGMSDPDKGDWEYEHNAFGELVRQSSIGKSQATTMSYDLMGRMVLREDYLELNDSNRESSTEWIYDSAPMLQNQVTQVGEAEGQLAQVIHTSTLEGSTSIISKTMTYDEYGRPNTVTTNIDGDSYTERTTYDELSRVFQVFDASGNSRGTRAHYNSAGYLSELRETAIVNGEQKLYVQIQKKDARGRTTQELLGNGLTTTRFYDPQTGYLRDITTDLMGVYTAQNLHMVYDAIGNVREKENRKLSRSEYYCYDELHRLVASSLDPCSDTDDDYQYDSYGNITFKKGVGNFTYAANGAGPHAATSAGGTNFSYDANGNMFEDDSGRNFYYTVFDKPYKIENEIGLTSFRYGGDRSRYERVDVDASGTMTTRYIGSVEFIDGPDGQIVKRYINGQAIVTENLDAGGQVTERETHYLLKDHLGSIDVIVGQLIGESSTEEKSFSFDAWGKRRDAVNLTSDLNEGELQSLRGYTSRGYTGHEMVDNMGIIHANGRIYDPSIGRFLSADPFVQAPHFTQSYNRYSYVVNNPIRYRDPSGYFFVDFIVAAVGAFVVGNAAQDLDIPLLATAASIAGCSTGNLAACSGAVFGSSYGTQGDFKEAVKSGVLAYGQGMVFQGIGGKFTAGKGIFSKNGFWHVASHAAAGGVFNVLRGGKFGHGFVSAGITKAITPHVMSHIDNSFEGAFLMGLIGGSASKITGGKFANGALSSSMQFVFNAWRTAAKQALKASLAARRELRNARARGVARAWRDEIKLVQATGEGSRRWTKAELAYLKRGEKVPGYHGHHVNSVAANSVEMAEKASNIKFLTRIEHFAEHGFNWRNATTGPLIDRTFQFGIIILNATELVDPVAITESAMELEQQILFEQNTGIPSEI